MREPKILMETDFTEGYADGTLVSTAVRRW